MRLQGEKGLSRQELEWFWWFRRLCEDKKMRWSAGDTASEGSVTAE